MSLKAYDYHYSQIKEVMRSYKKKSGVEFHFKVIVGREMFESIGQTTRRRARKRESNGQSAESRKTAEWTALARLARFSPPGAQCTQMGGA